MTLTSISILFLSLLIVLLGTALLWGFMRSYRREMGIEKEEPKKKQDTAFIINAFHDVTKQLKEKEKELERLKSLAEQRADNVASYNENILQCVTNGVMTFDKNCRLTTMNRAAEEMLACETAKIGMSCRELFDNGDITRAVHQTIQRKIPSARLEEMLDRPSGKLWLGFNTAVLTDRSGEALGVILSFSDLTEVKRLQEQVELRERLTALGEMSAGIAHELRNPMAVISGYVNLLSKKTDSQKTQAIIRDITSEINGMNRIIDDLLTFARPASLNRVRTDVRELLEGCMTNVLQATAAGPRITAIVNTEKLELSIDEVLMRQAFTNLLQNAIEAISDVGTITVDVKIGRQVKISVRDTGTGLRADTLKKIFLPFFTTKDRGVGLGLALVHKIVLSHGGRIEAESTEGKGTTFTVILPR